MENNCVFVAFSCMFAHVCVCVRLCGSLRLSERMSAYHFVLLIVFSHDFVNIFTPSMRPWRKGVCGSNDTAYVRASLCISLALCFASRSVAWPCVARSPSRRALTNEPAFPWMGSCLPLSRQAACNSVDLLIAP